MENYRKNNRGKSSPIVQYVVIRVCLDNSVSKCDERKPRCVSWGSESAKSSVGVSYLSNDHNSLPSVWKEILGRKKQWEVKKEIGQSWIGEECK